MKFNIILLCIFALANLQGQENFDGFSVQRKDGSTFFIQKIYHQTKDPQDLKKCPSGLFIAFQRCEMEGENPKNCVYYNHIDAQKKVDTSGPLEIIFGKNYYTPYRSKTERFYCTDKIINSGFNKWLEKQYRHEKTVGNVLKWGTFITDIGISIIFVGPIALGVKSTIVLKAAKSGAKWVFKRFAGKKALRAGAIVVGTANVAEGFIYDLEWVLRQSSLFDHGYKIAEYAPIGLQIFSKEFCDPNEKCDLAIGDYADQFFEKSIDSNFSSIIKLASIKTCNENGKATSYDFWSKMDSKIHPASKEIISEYYY